jgi:hypothetical protein
MIYVLGLIEMGWLVLERKTFNNAQYFFTLSAIISPWTRVFHFIWRSLNPLPSKIICTKFWSKLVLWFWRSRKCETFMDRQLAIRKTYVGHFLFFFFFWFASYQNCKTYLPATGRKKQALKNKSTSACCIDIKDNTNLVYFIFLH